MSKSISLKLVPVLLVFLISCSPVRRDEKSALRDTGIPTQSLEQKIDDIWTAYTKARAQLIKRVDTDQAEMTRQEWEILLGTAPALDASELQALETMHRGVISAAKKSAKSDSKLDLNRIRTDGRAKEFCEAFPKGAMLHIHPWGTLDEPSVRAILKAVDPVVDFTVLKSELETPGDSGIFFPSELAVLETMKLSYQGKEKFSLLTPSDQETVIRWFFLPPGPQEFPRFLGVFTVISKLVFSNQNVDPEPIMYKAFFERAKRHNVQYIEISQFIKTFPSWINGLEAWAKQVRVDHDIEVSLLAAFTRSKDPAATRKSVTRLLKLPKSGRLTGVNFLADEEAHPAFEKGQTLYVPLLASAESGSSSLKRSIHAGELGDPRNSRDAIIMGVQRIGHGVKLRDDSLSLELARKQKIHIEANLISNLRLKVVPAIQQHPFLDFLRLGLQVSWSTDDEGIFESTISDECTEAVSGTDIEYSELQALARNGIEGSFIGDSIKQSLQNELTQRFSKLESDWAQYQAVSN